MFHTRQSQCFLKRSGRTVRNPLNTFLIPCRAISVISAAGKPFHDPAADTALFSAVKAGLRPDIPVVELDVEINDPAFARACAETLLRSLGRA